jgi:SAM-dependent methyltransferase
MSAADRDEVTASASEEVQTLYTELALYPEKDFGWGKGKENARTLDYDTEWLDRLPDRVWESAAAVGNPFHLGPIRRAETVVDLGCGAGVDLCIAALLVGDEGQAIGIDFTPAMVAKAEENARLTSLSNVEVYEADIASLPLEDACTDVAISNASINLSSHKACVFKEVFRILRPGGRLQFADMVKDANIESALSARSASWADCVAGTVEPDSYLKMLDDAGFRQVEFVSFTGYRTAATTIGACFRALKP